MIAAVIGLGVEGDGIARTRRGNVAAEVDQRAVKGVACGGREVAEIDQSIVRVYLIENDRSAQLELLLTVRTMSSPAENTLLLACA